MTRVVLRLAPNNIRRWHVSLAASLKAAGWPVTLCLIDDDAAPCPVDTLRRFERRLFHIEPAAAGEKIAAWPGDIDRCPAPPEDAIILDCAGGPPIAGARTLIPDFCGLPDEAGLVANLLRHQPPEIGWRRASDGALLASGRTALASPHVIAQGFDHACARMADLGLKALRLVAGGAGVAVEARVRPAMAGAVHLFAHAAREAGGRIAARLLGRRPPLPRWNVGWRRIPARGSLLDTGQLGDEPFRWLAVDPARFVADPFLFVHEGRTFVFVEELPFATWRGFISVFEIGADGTPTPMRPVLERPYHLSYPSVFSEDGAIWMIPETGANRSVELYRADPFPDLWVLERVLIADIDASDATYFRHGGRCWLAVSTASGGASSWDSLSLYHAESLAGPWVVHPLNPVLTDPARARPAGWLHAGPLGLIRPAQDCVGGYGAALALNRVSRLDTEAFEETPLVRIAAPPSWNARGLHTVTQAGSWEVIDAVF